jgi:uncharacterized membrane protein YcaP (DUF421 family)
MVLVRVAARRFPSEAAPFNVILGVMLGAILSRTIIGPSSMIPTIACAVLLVLIHWLVGRVSFHRVRLGDFLQGRPDGPVQDSRHDADSFGTDHSMEANLDQTLRFWGGAADLSDARLVTLQRGGHISFARRR